MQQEEITAIFDQQASSYDTQWSKLTAINDALHLLSSAVLADLPPDANILCVGSGTGTEILHLARKFPNWRFTAVEPSAPMLEVFRLKAEEQGILSRCVLHAGYLDSLPEGGGFDAATAFLVSQFILDREERAAFFQGIADRLRPGGILISSDLSADLDSTDGRKLIETWFRLMNENGISPEGVARMRQAYTRDVAVIPDQEIREIITRGGFDAPCSFFQAGMIRAWHSGRKAGKGE